MSIYIYIYINIHMYLAWCLFPFTYICIPYTCILWLLVRLVVVFIQSHCYLIVIISISLTCMQTSTHIDVCIHIYINIQANFCWTIGFLLLTLDVWRVCPFHSSLIVLTVCSCGSAYLSNTPAIPPVHYTSVRWCHFRVPFLLWD